MAKLFTILLTLSLLSATAVFANPAASDVNQEDISFVRLLNENSPKCYGCCCGWCISCDVPTGLPNLVKTDQDAGPAPKLISENELANNNEPNACRKCCCGWCIHC